jgi:hypothetical protein
MKKKILSCLISSGICAIAYSQDFTELIPIDDTGDRPYNIATGLIDNDLLPDIIIANYNETSSEIEWYKNNDDGTFTGQGLIANTVLGIGGLKLVDLDGDEDLDFVITGYVNNKVDWFSNDGNGNFTDETDISTTTAGAAGLAVADLDNNMTPDVIATANTGNEIVWFSNNGLGSFTYGGVLDNTIIAPGSINFMNIDDDDDLDAVVTDSNFNQCEVNILRSTFSQDGIVNNYSKDSPAVTTNKYYLFNAAFADVDGDEFLDILATDVSYSTNPAGAYWYEYDSDSGIYVEKPFITTMANPAVIQFRDMDEDGLKDIVLSNGQGEGIEPGNTDLVWYKNSGTGEDTATRFGTERIIDTTQSQVFVYSIVDFDGDGDLDISTLSYNGDSLNYFDNLFYNTLGVDESLFQNLKIYPNPTSNMLFFNGLNEDFKVSVYDILGKEILNVELSVSEALNVSTLTSGVYILRLIDQNVTFKFVKE